MVELLFFGTYAFVLLAAAIGVIASRNPVHSAMFLVLAFVTSAVLWLMLQAEFLAIVLVLVYVGAVMVLFLFVIMMLDIDDETLLRQRFLSYAPVGIIIATIAVAQIWSVVWLRSEGLPVLERITPAATDYSNTAELGAVLYTEYVYPFELAAFVLLLAIIAAIVLTMRRRPNLKVQDVSKQVAVNRNDRVRIVKMDAETD
ncbi:MAG: NADH-quinone oxidoreductase subunit J [Gammaproteobacteria bacterium]|nr:NADH-quinone oxidoreductase subunit J [Gammaproteobacteria bacterium]NND54143.1 NADH-quinone oxidoreductase subunit J [Gammaproteobacteria bacterium]